MGVANLIYVCLKATIFRVPGQEFIFGVSGPFMVVVIALPLLLAAYLLQRARAAQIATWIWGIVSLSAVLRLILDRIHGKAYGAVFRYWSASLVIAAALLVSVPSARAEFVQASRDLMS